MFWTKKSKIKQFKNGELVKYNNWDGTYEYGYFYNWINNKGFVIFSKKPLETESFSINHDTVHISLIEKTTDMEKAIYA